MAEGRKAWKREECGKKERRENRAEEGEEIVGKNRVEEAIGKRRQERRKGRRNVRRKKSMQGS